MATLNIKFSIKLGQLMDPTFLKSLAAVERAIVEARLNDLAIVCFREAAPLCGFKPQEWTGSFSPEMSLRRTNKEKPNNSLVVSYQVDNLDKIISVQLTGRATPHELQNLEAFYCSASNIFDWMVNS